MARLTRWPLRDVCAHAAALNPSYLVATDVPADVVAKEKAIVLEQIKGDPKNANKPANIMEKIAEGKFKTWLGENVLVETAAGVRAFPFGIIGRARLVPRIDWRKGS